MDIHVAIFAALQAVGVKEKHAHDLDGHPLTHSGIRTAADTRRRLRELGYKGETLRRACLICADAEAADTAIYRLTRPPAYHEAR